MNVGVRLAAFGAAAVVAGLVGAGLGQAVGPLGTEPAPHEDPAHEPGGHEGDGQPAEADHGDDHAGGGAAEGEGDVGGLAVVAEGYRLELRTATVPAGPTTLVLAVLDPEGHAVTRVDAVHERPLHLVVVRRDLVGYHHLHPTLGPDGTWSVAADLASGSYRVVADLRPTGGPELALGADLTVTGTEAPDPLPAPSRTATAGDLEVTLDGDLAVGEHDLSFTVRRDGEVVTPDPYLGARGHLVAIRQGDMGYLHVHPHEGERPEVAFTAAFPSAGTYRLFLDLSVDGEVRTVAFTVTIPGGHDHG